MKPKYMKAYIPVVEGLPWKYDIYDLFDPTYKIHKTDNFSTCIVTQSYQQLLFEQDFISVKSQINNIMNKYIIQDLCNIIFDYGNEYIWSITSTFDHKDIYVFMDDHQYKLIKKLKY